MLLTALAACSPRAARTTGYAGTPNAGVHALLYDAFVTHACTKLRGSFMGVEHREADLPNLGARSGTLFVESCELTAQPPSGFALAVSGVLWEAYRQPHPDARFREPLALRVSGRMNANVVVVEDAASGDLVMRVAPGALVHADVAPVGPNVASPRGFGPAVADFLGDFRPMVAAEVKKRGTRSLRTQLRSNFDVRFNPRSLQATVTTVGEPPRPFPATTWLLNERVLMDARTVAVRGLFPPGQRIGVRANAREGVATMRVVCKDALHGISNAVHQKGSAGALGLVRSAERESGEIPLGGAMELPGRSCPWLVVLIAPDSRVAFDLLVVDERMM